MADAELGRVVDPDAANSFRLASHHEDSPTTPPPLGPAQGPSGRDNSPRRGILSFHALSAAVAAALGRSPYEWTERLEPVVEQALKKQHEAQQEAPDVDGLLSRAR
jgi:hypothetical protein